MAWNQLLYQMTLCRFAIVIAADAAAAVIVVVAIASASFKIQLYCYTLSQWNGCFVLVRVRTGTEYSWYL